MFDNKIKRNKFLVSIGTGIAGFFLLRVLPFNIFPHKINSVKRTVIVRLDPHAVSRNKIGNTHV
ncbi:MAG: hypothetical protein P4L35_19690 [Ignavibacteriaceae bacterium]|nr:hypothetical protein [Ignavibacteriaceae bacterium]